MAPKIKKEQTPQASPILPKIKRDPIIKAEELENKKPFLKRIPGKDETADTLTDRKNRAITALLAQFTRLVQLATEPVAEGATKENAAAQAFRMEVESQALVRAAEDLLQLTRELKEMWLFGPLRGIGEDEGEGKMDEESKKVGQMVEALLNKNLDDQST